MRGVRPVAYGLLGLHPWDAVRYTVRELEEAIEGAQRRYEHLVDLVMRHAHVTGQWSRRVEFRDLTGRAAPLPLDPRHVVPEGAPMTADEEEAAEKAERARAVLAEHEQRMEQRERG